MTSFDDRERAEEARFAANDERQFKILARRNKVLGLWAAEILGLSGEEAEAYGKSVVMADFEEAGDEDVVRKLAKDFADAGKEVSDHQIRRQMAEILATVTAEI